MRYNDSPEAVVDLATLLQSGVPGTPPRASFTALVTRVTILSLTLSPMPFELQPKSLPAVLYECVLRSRKVMHCFALGRGAVMKERRQLGIRLGESRHAFYCKMSVEAVLPEKMVADYPRLIAIVRDIEETSPASPWM